jgi:branched-chain amino acid transport system substrate-binding protein
MIQTLLRACARAIRPLPMLVGAALIAACDSSSAPVVIGVAGPFGSTHGASMRQGAELAAREVNANGGIQSRPLELRFYDDAGNPDSALRVARAFVANPEVIAVVGHLNSGTTISAASAYQQGLPAVATSATSVLVTRLGDWIFRVASSDSANSVALASVARSIGVPTAVLYENDDYGRGQAETFRLALAGAGGQVVSVDPYLPRTVDLRPYLERMRERGVGLVFLAGLEVDAARIIEQAHAVGLEARFLGGDEIEGLTAMGTAFDGTLVGVLFHADASPRAGAFAAQFRSATGREADSFAALGYDATLLLAQAAREAGPDRKSIRDYLALVGREDRPAYEGVTGTIRFDGNGDAVDKEFAIGMIRDGRIHLAGGN